MYSTEIASHILSASPCTRVCIPFISPSCRFFSHRPVFTPPLVAMWSLFSFSPFFLSFQSYCSPFMPRVYLCTPTLGYLVYRAYANARAQRRRSFDSLLRFPRKRKKFIRTIKNALRDFIRVRKLPAWISKNYEAANRSARLSVSQRIYHFHLPRIFSVYAQVAQST